MVARERGPWEGPGGISVLSDRLKFSDRLEMFCILIGMGYMVCMPFIKTQRTVHFLTLKHFNCMEILQQNTIKQLYTKKKHKRSAVDQSQARHFARSEEMAKCLGRQGP